MPLGKHDRNKDGAFRRERADSTAGKLRDDYPEFKNVRADFPILSFFFDEPRGEDHEGFEWPHSSEYAVWKQQGRDRRGVSTAAVLQT
jgi:hypothetical protein